MLDLNIADVIGRLLQQMDKVVIGYADIKRFSIAAMLADQHVLLEGVPGTAKSLFVEVFQRAIKNSKSVRIQLTPDVKPMDLVGTKVFHPGRGRFRFEKGPLHGHNFVLADELNRAPGKTLSALLTAMQERRIYISGKEYVMPDPYFVMATENPVEQEGVYPLPEAQVDRFGAKLIVPYATAEEEEQILECDALDERDPHNVIEPVVSTEEIVKMRQAIKKGVYVSKAAIQYIVALVRSTRPQSEQHADAIKRDAKLKDLSECGSSVRGMLALRGFARVLAAMRGRCYVLPEDIQEATVCVLCHRLKLKFEAQADGTTSTDVVQGLMKVVPFSKDNDKYVPAAK